MKLSKEQLEQFKGYCEEETHLTIHGFNDVGQRFETVARVSRTSDASPAVFENEIFFEFGEKRKHVPYSAFLAPFMVDYESDSFFGTELIIEKICLDNGEVIYQNPDAEKYAEIAQRQGEEKLKKQQAEGRDLVELDPITEKLSEYIGKPIIIGGQKWGVLASYGGANNRGETMINVRDASLCGGLSIPQYGQFDTCDVDGNISYVEANGKDLADMRKVDKIFANRVARIMQNQKEPGETE